MTEQLNVGLAEQMRIQTTYLQNEYLLPFAFGVIDAALREYFSSRFSGVDRDLLKYKRVRFTDASARYTLLEGKVSDLIEFADMNIRMIGLEKTHITVEPRPLPASSSPDAVEYMQGLVKLQLFGFIAWLWADQARMRDIKSPTPQNTMVVSTDPFTAAPGAAIPDEIRSAIQSAIGRPGIDYNEWARQEIARGKDRDEVFKGYLERIPKDPDIDEDEAIELAKDRFRKALSRTKRTKRTK